MIENGAASIAAGDLWFPNGMVIVPGGKMLIVAETFAARLTAFDLDNGRLANRRVFAGLPGLFPDGICLDAEGAVWVACAGARKVVRVIEGGRITGEILLEDRSAYACMLGGDDRRDLYLCTARDHRPERTVPLRSGRIELARVDVPGPGLP
jgi:sugar lactone lactonase YvrE